MPTARTRALMPTAQIRLLIPTARTRVERTATHDGCWPRAACRNLTPAERGRIFSQCLGARRSTHQRSAGEVRATAAVGSSEYDLAAASLGLSTSAPCARRQESACVRLLAPRPQ